MYTIYSSETEQQKKIINQNVVDFLIDFLTKYIQ